MEEIKTTFLGAKVILISSSALLIAALKNTLMSCLCRTLLVTLFAVVSFGQSIKSGQYGTLSLAFDPATKKLTGYFEDHTGWDEQTKAPRFSCVFYIEGLVTGNTFEVSTYYPNDKFEDTIIGEIEIVNNQTVKIKLPNDHGGCWNVQHFADEPVAFNLDQPASWKQIKFVTKNKSYFYSDNAEHKKQNSFLVKNDFVHIDKRVGKWAFCTFFGDKKATKGWMKMADLNAGSTKKQ
ncbi:MAG: hypothetical protein CFE24_01120 [Flavobacterium sp. BFFFF2]|nr:MAG: hypothetical protein CFE24_01120 [Flavobacterium sp. BFFFF2]